MELNEWRLCVRDASDSNIIPQVPPESLVAAPETDRATSPVATMPASRAPSAAPSAASTALSESVASVGGDVEPILAQHQGSPTQGYLLPFHRSIIRGLVPNDEQALDEGDALLILARGLGLRRVIACVLKVYDSPRNLVLVVNATSDEEYGLRDELTRLHSTTGLRSVTYDMLAKQREQLYLSGGLISVTSRILIVDLLNKVIPTEMITGLVIMHAEKVSPNSTEAFIVRVYREHNQVRTWQRMTWRFTADVNRELQNGFVKAFSDQPEHFSLGFSPLRTVLTQLQISKVELWPRFHESVKRDVGDLDAAGKKKSGKSGANVIQVYQPLSQAQTEIQSAIVECLDATLAELKKGTKEINVDDYTFENSLFPSFDSIVRRQLNPIWHRVGFKTKQLVGDLKTLRGLLQDLLSDDPVRFLKTLETVIAQPNPDGPGARGADRSSWLGMDAANTMITKAKGRVYSGRITAAMAQQALVDSVTAAAHGITAEEEEEEALREAHDHQYRRANVEGRPAWLPPGIEPVLDELPKWHALRDIMDEIEQEIHFQSNDLTGITNNTVLIMVNGDSTCHQVREFLSTMDGTFIGAGDGEQGDKPAHAMMTRNFRRYLIWKSGLGTMKTNAAQALASAATAALAASNVPNQASTSSDAIVGVESAALKRKAESGRGRLPAEKRRRQRGGGSAGGSGRMQKTTIAEAGQEAEDLAAFTQRSLEMAAEDMVNDSDDSDVEFLGGDAAEAGATGASENFTEHEFDSYFGLLSMENLVVVRPYASDNDDNVLQELRPRFVVMYDPSSAFTRRLEVYRALNPTTALRSYFLIYRASVEEQHFLSATRREKESFERLIREKSTMALTINSDGRPGPQDASARRYVRTVSSRSAGGQRASDEPPKVLVDVREFRSSLPSMLHLAGMKVVPLTLTVGDYILAPTICVERKSVADLISSFNNGRLYSQCELMAIHYEHPVLLIEFGEDKSFSLEALNGQKKLRTTSTALAKSTPSEMDTQAKLVILTTNFPRLRVVWSSSPLATADIFTELKSTYEEPDERRVAGVGLEEGEVEGGTAGGDGVFNLAAQDMLRAMPGVTTKTYRHVMNQVRDMQEMCSLPQMDIQHVVGSEAARTLTGFTKKDYTKRAKR